MEGTPLLDGFKDLEKIKKFTETKYHSLLTSLISAREQKLQSLFNIESSANSQILQEMSLLFLTPDYFKTEAQYNAIKQSHNIDINSLKKLFKSIQELKCLLSTNLEVHYKNFVKFDREEAEVIFSLFTRQPQYSQITQILRIPKFIPESVVCLGRCLFLEASEVKEVALQLEQVDSFTQWCGKLNLVKDEVIVILKMCFRALDDSDFDRMCNVFQIDKMMNRIEFKTFFSFVSNGVQRRVVSLNEGAEEVTIRQQISFLSVIKYFLLNFIAINSLLICFLQ